VNPTDAILQIHPLIAWRRVEDHVFVLTDRDEFMTIDDPVGLAVWSVLAEAPQDVEGLTEHLLSTFDVKREQLRQDLAGFLETLLEHRAVEVLPELDRDPTALS
jgi:Coenzyme PQQ synthesis protein D (PqqD)